jgi:hypothetical protein
MCAVQMKKKLVFYLFFGITWEKTFGACNPAAKQVNFAWQPHLLLSCSSADAPMANLSC